MKNRGRDEVFEVVWPGGRSADAPIAPTLPLPDLNGKVIAELWDRLFRGDRIFPRIRELLLRRFPYVKFVEYERLGDTFGWNEREVVAGLPKQLKELGIDGVISGIGA